MTASGAETSMMSPALGQREITPVTICSGQPSAKREFWLTLAALTALICNGRRVGNRRYVWFDELSPWISPDPRRFSELWYRVVRFDCNPPTSLFIEPDFHVDFRLDSVRPSLPIDAGVLLRERGDTAVCQTKGRDCICRYGCTYVVGRRSHLILCRRSQALCFDSSCRSPVSCSSWDTASHAQTPAAGFICRVSVNAGFGGSACFCSVYPFRIRFGRGRAFSPPAKARLPAVGCTARAHAEHAPLYTAGPVVWRSHFSRIHFLQHAHYLLCRNLWRPNHGIRPAGRRLSGSFAPETLKQANAFLSGRDCALLLACF